jgi:putative aldouronate transport system substrate-binding protein
MKKILLPFVMTFVFVLLLAACTRGSNENTTEIKNNEGSHTEVTNEQTKVKQTEKTFTMLLGSHGSWPYKEDWQMWNWIEDRIGAQLKVESPSGSMGEAINLYIASGTLPDITYMGNLDDANIFGQQGVFANILDYLEYMPNLQSWLKKYPNIATSSLASDGGMYMLPNEGFGEANRITWMYRQDIFEKHGLTPPTTWDELYEVSKELKKLYPDSYPFTIWAGLNNMLKWAAPQFGTTSPYWYGNGYYQGDSGKVHYGPVDDNFKLLLQYFHKFYKDGLMPPDWVTLDLAQYTNLVSTDRTFMTADYIAQIDYYTTTMRQANPDFTYAFMPPPAGVEGKNKNVHHHVLEQGLSISSKSDKIVDILRAYDWFYTEEARELVSWGDGDVLFVNENGEKKMNPNFLDVSAMRTGTGWATNGSYIWFDFNAWLVPSIQEVKDAYKQAWEGNYYEEYKTKPQLTEAERNSSAIKNGDILKHAEESMVKFILGDRSFDEWDQYVSELEKLGMNDMIELVTKAYERME